MSSFYSPPPAKTIKFNYCSPQHNSTLFPTTLPPTNTARTMVRAVTNYIPNSTPDDAELPGNSPHLFHSRSGKRAQKQNWDGGSRGAVCESVIVGKPVAGGSSCTPLGLAGLEEMRSKRRFQQFCRTEYVTPSPAFQQDQKLELSGGFNKRLVQRLSEPGKSFSFSKAKPRQRTREPGLSVARIEDFTVGELIGKGSSGNVHLVRHDLTNLHYALKIITKKEVKDVGQLTFAIKAHSFLTHPNIAQLYACFSDTDHVYLLMELCTHGNLGQHRKRVRSEEERGKIMAGIARGVEHMHSLSLRHGDLKLENVLINHGFPKLTDFDCVFSAKHKDFLKCKRRSRLWGSPAYFSPDMVRENVFSLKDDIWSFGIIAYELYNNYHPFNLKDSEDLLNIVQQEMSPMLGGLREETKTVIRRMLEKDKEGRATIEQILSYFV